MARIGERKDAERAAPRDADAAALPAERLAGTGRSARLWLVRHGEVDAAWRGVAYGGLDVPLSDEGRETARRVGAAFGALLPGAILSSDLERARAMAREVARVAGLAERAEPALREIDRGRWQGRRVEELLTGAAGEVEAFHADPWHWRGHGGECDADVFARVAPVLEEAVAACPGRVIVVCAHYNVIRVAVGRALGIPPPRTFGVRVDPGRAVLLEDAPAGWVLHRSNVVAPREDEDPADPTHPSHHRGAPVALAQRREEP